MNKKELLPYELMKQIPALYSGEAIPANEKIIKVKYFIGSFTWLVAECETDGDDVLFFGYVINHGAPDCSEWGYFTLNQLAEIKVFGFIEVERDLYFKECTFGKYMEELENG